MRRAEPQFEPSRSGAVLEVERRLARLGCPRGCVRRNVRELADHFDDLKQAALEEGMSEAAAEARATELLGEPVGLAEHMAFVFRQSSWWGRHPIIGLCLLPNLCVMPLALLCLLVFCGGFWLSNFLPGTRITFSDMSEATTLEPDSFKTLFSMTNVSVNCGAVGLLAVLFCWLARRSASGLKWSFATCGVASLNGLFSNFMVRPGLVSFSYSNLPEWLPAAVPWLVFAAIWLTHWRAQRRLAFYPAMHGPSGALSAFQLERAMTLPKMKWITPSSILASAFFAAIVGLSIWVVRESEASNTLLKSKTWPEELAAASQRVQARQSVCETTNATAIDLTKFVNANLADSIQPKNKIDDNLAELPPGLHIYGGIPFEVKGRVQLLGRGWLDEEKKYPIHARAISISRKCARLHLLHGASCVPQEEDGAMGVKIAALVLHYVDGSREEIPIRTGEHVLDWHGPAYTSNARAEEIRTTAPGTELAWLGSNPDLRRTRPAYSLRLYKSTFANPRPELEIASVDYVSTVTRAAPFLVGLTVE